MKVSAGYIPETGVNGSRRVNDETKILPSGTLSDTERVSEAGCLQVVVMENAV